MEEMVESRYSLVVLAAKRAKQLRDGAPKLIETASTNPITVALEEIAAGKVKYRLLGDDELLAIETRRRAAIESFEEQVSAEKEAAAAELAPSVQELLRVDGEEEQAEVVVEEALSVQDLLKVEGEDEKDEAAEEAAPKASVAELLKIEDDEQVAEEDAAEEEEEEENTEAGQSEE